MKRPEYTLLCKIATGVIFACMLLFLPLRAGADSPKDAGTAVIFAYQRIGEDTVQQGNISVEQFKEHINELKEGGYTVLPLAKIVDALQNGAALPPKTVGITFEGAYQATISNAMPLLEEAQMPFTLFFASDFLDSGNPDYISWKQVKRLKNNDLVSFGIFPSTYGHMVKNNAEQNADMINRAITRYREVLGEDPLFFAYPYGEYSSALKKQMASYKFKAVFGQHSGVLSRQSDFLALPRFSMTDEYGDTERFMLTASALPLPVSDVVPEDTVLTQNPPTIGFTVPAEIKNISKISCFASGLGKLPLSRIGANRIEIRPKSPFSDRRTRINCTLPDTIVVPGEARKWLWYGMLLVSPAMEEDDDSDADSPESAEDPEEQPENQ